MAVFANSEGPLEQVEERDVARSIRSHALGWWMAANLVGVWLAVLLIWPQWGDWMAPLSYGRWMPLHLNWQLYGWCALPLVGVLLKWILWLPHPQAVGHARVALAAWSMALALGGLSWLGGVTSGKLFLDWHGWARFVLPGAMTILWTVLAAHVWWGWRQRALSDRWAQAGVVAGLLAVPAVLYWVSSQKVYPAVNPDSGGATGAALLGSTLGIVAIFGSMPHGLNVRRLNERARSRSVAIFWTSWGLSMMVWLLIDRGNSSHHDGSQILGLGVLMLWVPMLVWWWRQFDWGEGARPWLHAAMVWWAILVLSGWLSFLPGISEKMKFTNGLVAHAHLAMAGLLTSVNGVILNQLDGSRPIRRGMHLWQTATAVHVLVLMVVGWLELSRPGEFFAGASWVTAGFAVRLLAGVAMTVASVQLFYEIRKS